MAYSGSISGTTFNALKVVDHAFMRCRLPPQAISSEMQKNALEALYLFLSDQANLKTPSWTIEQIILPFVQGQPAVVLPVGTVEVMNVNYRQLLGVTGTSTQTSATYELSFLGGTVVSTVGYTWNVTGVAVEYQISDDGLIWTTVDTIPAGETAGIRVWHDITPATAANFFRIWTAGGLDISDVYVGNTPQMVPFGVWSQDTYTNQSNLIQQGQPTCYWFQRDLPLPQLNVWPAPSYQAQLSGQIVLWRHRQIMDTQNLQQDVEVPQRWLEAIVAGLAFKVAEITPAVDLALVPILEGRWYAAQKRAMDGDNDGSPMFIQPWISPYTR